MNKWHNMDKEDNCPLEEFKDQLRQTINQKVKLPIITMRSGSTYIGEWYNMQKEG